MLAEAHSRVLGGKTYYNGAIRQSRLNAKIMARRRKRIYGTLGEFRHEGVGGRCA